MTLEETLAMAQAATRAMLTEPYREPTAEEMLTAYRRAYPEREAMLAPDGKSLRIVMSWPVVVG